MSKSRGTFIMARTYLDAGLEPDALRYYFAAKSSGDVDDLDLNLSDFVARVNADLVGKLVNLASRCASFIGTRFNGQLADILPDRIQYDQFVAALTPIRDAYERNDTASAIRQTMQLADEANKYIDETKPWIIAKQHHADAQLHAVCTQGLNLFRVLITATQTNPAAHQHPSGDIPRCTSDDMARRQPTTDRRPHHPTLLPLIHPHRQKNN